MAKKALLKVMNAQGSIEGIYPKTSADVVEYTNSNVTGITNVKGSLDDLYSKIGTGTGTSLSGRITTLETAVGDSTKGLVKGVSDLNTDVTSLETIVGTSTSTGLRGDVSTLQTKMAGLSGAMRFIGVSTTNPTGTGPTITGVTKYQTGDVVIYNNKEFVCSGTNQSGNLVWREFGDEGSHALKTISITGTGALGGGGTLESNRTITHNTGSAASKTIGLYKFSTDAYSHIASVTAVTTSDIIGLGGIASTSVATKSANGLMSSSDKTKLDGIATGAEVNQNAFAKVQIGTTVISADAKQDTLNLVAGDNVTLTADASNDKVTISAVGYAEASTTSTGLMSTEDKTYIERLKYGYDYEFTATYPTSTATEVALTATQFNALRTFTTLKNMPAILVHMTTSDNSINHDMLFKFKTMYTNAGSSRIVFTSENIGQNFTFEIPTSQNTSSYKAILRKIDVASTASVSAKPNVYVQANQPTNLKAGDIWFCELGE